MAMVRWTRSHATRQALQTRTDDSAELDLCVLGFMDVARKRLGVGQQRGGLGAERRAPKARRRGQRWAAQKMLPEAPAHLRALLLGPVSGSCLARLRWSLVLLDRVKSHTKSNCHVPSLLNPA